MCDNIDEWSSLNLARKFDLSLDSIARRDTLQRISVKLVSHREFVEKIERLFIPVVLTDVTDSWAAREKWTLEGIAKRYRNERFKCGEDDFGYNVRMKFKYFLYYMRTNCDDSPLYIFDGNFGEVNNVQLINLSINPLIKSLNTETNNSYLLWH